MHYYKRNIGDYAKKAGHLSALEHGVYNLILDAYYDTERAPTRAEALRQARARTKHQVVAVDSVLAEFFNCVDDRFVQKRVEEEIAKYRERAQSNQRVAEERERKRRGSAEHDSCSTGDDVVTNRQPNQEPLTNNQEPKEKKKEKASARKSAGPLTFDGWINSLPEGVPAIPEDHHALAYADRAGIPFDFVLLAWTAFERKYTKGEGAKKKYKDWPDVFRNALEGNWLKLWYIDGDGAYQLTTAGQQLQRAEAGK